MMAKGGVRQRGSRRGVMATAALLALLAAACGDGAPGGHLSDMGASGGAIGQPCAAPAVSTCPGSLAQLAQGSCAAGEVCLPEACGYLGGYCTADCQSAACPAGSTCVETQTGIFQCMKSCGADGDCRSAGSYECLTPLIAPAGVHAVCYPYEGGSRSGSACVTSPPVLPPAGFTAPNVPVAHDASDLFDAEGNVAVDGRGHAAVSYIAGTGAAGVASFSEGMGFAQAASIFGTTYPVGGAVDPVVAYDRSASPPRLYLCWLDLGSASVNQSKIMVAHSDANGAPGTWSTPVQVSPGSDAANGVLDKPWIVARSGTVVVTYTQFLDAGGSTSHVRVVRSPDGAATWMAPINADLATALGADAVPVLDAAGDLWVAWWSLSGSAARILVGAEPAGMPSFTRNVLASGTVAVGDLPSLAVTDDGSALWTVFADGTQVDGNDLWAALSKDGGRTFGTPIQVNDDVPAMAVPCASHFRPAVAVDALGRPHVLWYDNRVLRGNVLYAYSNDGLTFTANAAVNDAEFDFTVDRTVEQWLGDYLGIAVDGMKVYATWADPRSGVSRMYFAERPLP